jgi:hypothetical protein
MENFENHNEALSIKEQVESAIKESKVEQKKLKADIEENEDKI